MEENQQQQQVETEVQQQESKLLEETQSEIAELQKQLAAQRESLRAEKINFAFEREGLKDFAEFIHIEDDSKLNETVAKLKGLIDGIKSKAKQEVGYVPSEHKQEKAYDQAKQQGNTKGMIKSLFGI